MNKEIKQLKEQRKKLISIIERHPKNEEQRKAIESARRHLRQINNILGALNVNRNQ